MAVGAINVFVDDAVSGRLPAVCARTGSPAESVERIDERIGGPSPLVWLLLVLGPLGIVLIVLAYAVSRRETLTVRLPVSAAAWQRELALRKVELGAWVVFAAAFVAAFVELAGVRAGWFVLAPVALVVALVVHGVSAWRQPRASIDVSRRWVTIANVDDRFVAALRAQPAAERSPDVR
jgi:hypothetical protein